VWKNKTISRTQTLAGNHGLLCSGSTSVEGTSRADDQTKHHQFRRVEPVATEFLVAASLILQFGSLLASVRHNVDRLVKSESS
jgi:hypothetical protein